MHWQRGAKKSRRERSLDDREQKPQPVASVSPYCQPEEDDNGYDDGKGLAACAGHSGRLHRWGRLR